MKWPPLVAGKLLRRYKRFLADVELEGGAALTVHCPNSGSMLQCREPGRAVRLSVSHSPGRRYSHTWELYHNGASWIAVNTHRANQIARETLDSGLFAPFAGFRDVRAEVPYGKSRADFAATDASGRAAWIEVKSVSLVDEGGRYTFPDAVTLRGQKHLEELMRVVREGDRGILWFILMREDGKGFRPAAHIDPVYAALMKEAMRAGVEIVVSACRVNEMELTVTHEEALDLRD